MYPVMDPLGSTRLVGGERELSEQNGLCAVWRGDSAG